MADRLIESDVTVAAMCMVKNEELRIASTLKSLIDVAGIKDIIVLDTGSVDGTVDVVRTACKDVRLHLKEIDSFTSYSAGYNTLLDFADELCPAYDYYLLVDANDQFVGKLPPDMSSFTDDVYNVQRMWTSAGGRKALSFWIPKFIHSNRPLIRYDGQVHAWLNTGGDAKCIHTFCIVQDRDADSKDRYIEKYKRDESVLERVVQDDPTDARNTFYLAQTYDSLGKHEEALEMYRRRSTMTNGFWEERYHAMIKCGLLCKRLNRSATEFFMQSIELWPKRADGYYHLGIIYGEMNLVELAYAFIRTACMLPIPADAKLFVDRSMYAYDRWVMFSVYAYRFASRSMTSGDDRVFDVMREGASACVSASMFSRADVGLLQSNMQFFDPFRSK